MSGPLNTPNVGNRKAGSATGIASTAEHGLSLDAYQARTADTAVYPGKGTVLGLIYCGLKLAGEAGEVAEKIGKAIRDDGMMVPLELVVGETWRGKEIGVPETMIRMKDGVHPDRRDALKGELGDVLWYVASAARELGYDLADIAQANLDKLADRAARGTLQGSGDNR